MKLQVKDQIVVSSVQPDMLRPGQVIEVDEAQAQELLTKRPDAFVALSSDGKRKAKADVAPANKADTRRKTKAATI